MKTFKTYFKLNMFIYLCIGSIKIKSHCLFKLLFMAHEINSNLLLNFRAHHIQIKAFDSDLLLLYLFFILLKLILLNRLQ